MKIVELEISNNTKCCLFFQNIPYDLSTIKHFYLESKEDKVEFLPGIFFRIKEFKTPLNFLRPLIKNVEFLNVLLDKVAKNQIQFEFRNIRDTYKLIKDNEILYENKKRFTNNDMLDIQKIYKPSNTAILQTEIKQVSTKDILFPQQSGGWANRCILKGILGDKNIQLFDTIDVPYNFLNEYELHALAQDYPILKKLCLKCKNCRGIIESMQSGSFIGASEKTYDCIKLSQYDNIYVIENGNHRVCCAKLFNIPSITAEVTTYALQDTQQPTFVSPYKPYLMANKKVPTNKEVLDYFYNTMLKIKFTKEEALDFLEKDGTNVTLVSKIFPK